MPDNDAELELKKRARRRLVGAVALALLAAIVLPMIMDEEPPASLQPIELKIPGQEQAAANPVAVATAPPTAAQPLLPAPVPMAADKPPTAEPPVLAPAKDAQKDAGKGGSSGKESNKETSKDAAKPAPDKAQSRDDSERARAILSGQANSSAPGYVILIGAFSNPANVKNLQVKLGELGVKVYTERLDAADGQKTRVRAGPFTTHEAAEKALSKMKRIGVGGVVAPRS
jgi:DedD protein